MDAKVLTIVKLLTERTKKGIIKWNATGTANEYKVVMDGGTVVVSSFLTAGATLAYSIKIFNKTGILALQESRSRTSDNYADLYMLFNAAKDSFTGKDSVIDEILNQLQ